MYTDRYIYLHVSIPFAPPGLSEHYSAPVLQRQCLQRSHADCFAGKIVIFEVGRRKRLSGVHRAKKCRNVWGETPCLRAGPHPSGWRSPGRDHLGEWGAVSKGARA